MMRSVALLLVPFSLAACMGGPMGPMHPGMPGFGDRPAVDSAPSPQPNAAEYVVVAGEFVFTPDEIEIRSGETVNVVLNNRGALFHDLTVPDLGFVLAADPGERSAGAITVQEPGRYPFICAVPGHADAGMNGTLVVLPEG